MRTSIRSKSHVGFFPIIGLLLVLVMNSGPALAGSLFLPVILKDYDGSNPPPPPPPPTGPTISTTSPLPTGTLGVNFSQTLQASGGTTPYTWAITGSVLLPTGLSLNPGTGVISGIPVNAGTFGFEVKVTDAHALSSAKGFSLIVNPATQFGAPAPPSELTAITLSPTSIGLDWKDNSSNETYFEIEQANDIVHFVYYDQFPGSSTPTKSCDDVGLTPDKLYCYRIRAHNTSGNSTYTNTACAWTQATVAPRAPTNLTAQALSSTQILLTWTNNSQSDEYRIYESKDGGVFVFAGTVSQDNVPGAYIPGLSAGHSYRYYIQAHNAIGYSANSNTSASVTTPGGSAGTVRIVNNSSYPIISLTIDGVQKFPQPPQGIPPNSTYEIPMAAGGHSYEAWNGFWDGVSRFTMYKFSGSWTQPAGTYTITLNNPTITQLLTKFGTSGYYLGEYWSGTNFHYKGFRFYNTGTYNYYLDGALAGTGTYSLAPGGYPGSYTVTFNVTGAQAATGYYSETGGTFYMKNGPSDWPVIYYNDAGN